MSPDDLDSKSRALLFPLTKIACAELAAALQTAFWP